MRKLHLVKRLGKANGWHKSLKRENSGISNLVLDMEGELIVQAASAWRWGHASAEIRCPGLWNVGGRESLYARDRGSRLRTQWANVMGSLRTHESMCSKKLDRRVALEAAPAARVGAKHTCRFRQQSCIAS